MQNKQTNLLNQAAINEWTETREGASGSYFTSGNPIKVRQIVVTLLLHHLCLIAVSLPMLHMLSYSIDLLAFRRFYNTSQDFRS